MTEPDQYVLGYRQAEQARLQQQAEQLAHESSWLFDQIPVARGARVVEIGCGPHGCLDLLSERVGPAGCVVGVERNAEAVALARTLTSQRNFGNVDVLEGDARSTGLPRASFDLTTSRLVLVNVPQPEQIVAEAAALVRPGGWVAFHEADYVSHVCDPPSGAWSTLVELLQRYREEWNRSADRAQAAASASRSRADRCSCESPDHVYPPGHGRRSLLLDFSENLSERLVAQKLVSESELTGLKADLSRHLADPNTLVVSHLYFQAWGRKPV